MGGVDNRENQLPDEIEHFCPDYTSLNYSIGFLSRGCPRNCPFCIVPTIEGGIRPHSIPEEFVRHKKAVMLDNNFLASPRWDTDLNFFIQNGIAVDFNQGLDARFVNRAVARRLSVVNWIEYPRFALDTDSMITPVKKAIMRMVKAGYRGRFFIYLLVEPGGVNNAYDRVKTLLKLEKKIRKGTTREGAILPFAQPMKNEKGFVSPEAREFARWVNRKAIFESVSWENYRG